MPPSYIYCIARTFLTNLGCIAVCYDFDFKIRRFGLRKLLLISISLIISIGAYADKPLNSYFDVTPSLYLECGMTAPTWIWIFGDLNAQQSPEAYIYLPKNPKIIRKMDNVYVDVYHITFRDKPRGETYVIDRMTSKLTIQGIEWTCTQYSMDEFNDRKQKFYDSIVKERKF